MTTESGPETTDSRSDVPAVVSDVTEKEVRKSIHRVWFASLLAVVLLSIYAVVPYDNDGIPAHVAVVFCVGLTLFSVILLYLVLRNNVGESPRDRWLRLISSLVALVASLVFFSLSYRQIANSSPGEFVGLSTFIDSLYFSLATALTVGFGDIYASGQVSRIMVIFQMIFTVIVVAATVRSISGILQLQTKQRKENEAGVER